MSEDRASKLLIWCDATRAGLVQDVVRLMPWIEVAALGGPRKAPLANLGDELEVKAQDDLRRVVIDHEADYLLLATTEDVSRDDIAAAMERGLKLVALQPHEALIDLAGSVDPADAMRVIIAPSMRSSPAWLSAADPLETLGKVRTVQASLLAPQSAGSLYARLYEAMDMIVRLLGLPQSIDAALTGPLPEPPQDPAALTGDITAHLRFTQGAAIVHVSDQAPRWSRGISVLSDKGRLKLTDFAYTLLDHEGRTIDANEAVSAGPREEAELIVHHWKRWADGLPPPKAVNPAQVLAACHAAVLSARTAQQESPQRLMSLR